MEKKDRPKNFFQLLFLEVVNKIFGLSNLSFFNKAQMDHRDMAFIAYLAYAHSERRWAY
jgi:hypothetical protein